MERIQALGSLARGGSQVYASLLQLGHCNPNFSSNRVASLRLPLLITRTQAILRNQRSGLKFKQCRKGGRVGCSESSITGTSTQAEIEVVQSLEEAENQSLKAVSGDNRPEGETDSGAEKDDRVSSTVQAALEEILSEDESAENTQFHSLEHEAVMVAATKVAEALDDSDEEVNVVSFPLLEPLSPMGAAVVTVWPEALEEDVQEEAPQAEEVGFMVQTEEPEYFAPPPEASTVVEEKEEDSAVDEEVAEEEPLLEPGAVSSALMVKEVADALKAPEEDTVSHMLEKETEVERLQGAEEKSLIEQLKDIVVFAGPALGIWLSGPIMGIIDTAVIGQSSSLELAALGKCYVHFIKIFEC